MESRTGLELAIIGVSGKFPQASNIEEFWKKIVNDEELLTKLSNEELVNKGFDKEYLSDNKFVASVGKLEQPEYFDAPFFGFSHAEAEVMDPQIRIMLQCAYESLQDAGYDPFSYPGYIGVYTGASANDMWEAKTIFSGKESQLGQFETEFLKNKDFISSHISYRLNLKGPSISTFTACSTSLNNVHLACQAILNGECDMALAGGVSINLVESFGYEHQEGMILAKDGKCKPFEKNSSGTISSDGAGVVVIKTLEDAIRDGDNIYATVLATCSNNDGSDKIGYTAPSLSGQIELMNASFQLAEISPESISYVEAHGTGTNLGDPIEFESLRQTFKTEKKHFCALGSLKSNAGHMDVAAGIGALIKTILALKHKVIPGTLHFEEANPHCDFENSPFYINPNSIEWKSENGVPRRAAVSSLGIGGSNAHVILEEYIPEASSILTSTKDSFGLLSAKSANALKNNIIQHRDFFSDFESSESDALYTLAYGREHMKYRAAFCVSNENQFHDVLSANSNMVHLPALEDPSFVFMYSGQGSQYSGMYYDLYKSEEIYRLYVDRCLSFLPTERSEELKGLLFTMEENDALINTKNSQTTLFICMYALSQYLINIGIQPKYLIGHSIGEYVCACIGGVFDVKDALELVEKRGECMSKAPVGAMLSVNITEQDLRAVLPNQVSIAAINSDNLSVVSGEIEAVDAFSDYLNGKGIFNKKLRTSHGFHSHLMDSILEEYRLTLNEKIKKCGDLTIPYISNVTGNFITKEDYTSPEYWVKQLRGEVKFDAGVKTLLKEKQLMLLELGPGSTLTQLVSDNKDFKEKESRVINLLPKSSLKETTKVFFKSALGKIWENGHDQIRSFLVEETGNRISLPTYPFEREKYWIETDLNSFSFSKPQGDSSLNQWLYKVNWEKKDLYELKDTSFAESKTLVLYHTTSVFEQDEQYTLEELPTEYGKSENISQWLSETAKHDIKERHIIFDLFEVSQSSCTLDVFERVFHSLLSVIDLAGNMGCENEKVSILLCEQNKIIGSEIINPFWSSLQGVVSTIGQEYSQFQSQVLDIDRNTTLSEIKSLLSKKVLHFTGYRNGIIWQRSYATFEVDESQKWDVKSGDTYVITGGFGNVGMRIVNYLAGPGVNIHVLGRNLPEKQTKTWDVLNGLKEKGTNIFPVCVNVNDQEEFNNVLNEIYNRHGKVTGIVHAAAQMKDCIKYIGELKPDDFKQVATTKITGADVIFDWSKNKSIEFVLMMSSLSTELGGLGYSLYATSNAYLDAKINLMPVGGTRFLSVNWDGWTTDEEAADGLIDTAKGKELLSWILRQTNLQTLVSSSSIEKRVQEWGVEVDGTESLSSENVKFSRPEISSDYVEPESNLEKELVNIWENFFRIDGVGIDDDFFELGGDSLKGMKLVNLYKNLLGEMVYVSIIFDALTIREIAQYMHKHYKKGACTIDNIAYDENDDSYDSKMSKEYFESKRSLIQGLDYKPIVQKNKRSVFILSSSRSGSTLLRVMLAGNSRLFAPPELELLNYTELTGELGNYQGLIRSIMEIKSCDVDEAQGHVQKMIDESWGIERVYHFLQEYIGDRILVEKTPSYSFNKFILNQIEKQFEDPIFIHLVRHPYGMINSKKNNKLDLLRGELDNLFSSGRELAEFEWVLSNTNIEEFLSSIPDNRKMFVRYEDLVINPKIAMKALSETIQIPFENSMLNPYDDKNVRMTDGLHQEGMMIGDPKFHEHKSISKDNAYKWREELFEDFLHQDTLALAKQYDYNCIEEMNQTDWHNCQEENKYPVSSQQRKLLIYHEIYPEEINYNIPRAILVGIELDQQKLNSAVRELSEMHPILKTQFLKENSVFYQAIADEMIATVVWHDSVSDENLNDKLKSIVRPYNLYEAPLFRVEVVPVEGRGNVIFFDTHHTLTDAISQNILISNLLSIYAGEEVRTEDLTYHYYALLQNSNVFKYQLSKQEDYWLNRYKGELPLLEIKTDFKRPLEMSFKGAEVSVSIENDLHEQFVSVTKALKVSRYNLAFALYQLFLHKLTGQDDIIVGTPLTSRPDSRFESTIGMFVNTLPIRSQVSFDQNFEKLVANTKEEIMVSFDNADYSLDSLINKLEVERDLSRNPLFDVMFVYQNFELEGKEIGNSNLSYVEFNDKLSRYDLSCVIYDFKDAINIHFEYSSELFSEKTVKSYLDFFMETIQSALQNISSSIDDFSLFITEEENNFLSSDQEDLTINFNF